MLRGLLSILLSIALASGIIAFFVLGEAWLLQKLFPLELWHIALIILGTMIAVLFTGGRMLEVAGITSLSLDFEDEDEDEDEDEEDYIGPPPWRRSSPSRSRRRRS